MTKLFFHDFIDGFTKFSHDIPLQKPMVALWSQGHETSCHDPEFMSSNPSVVELELEVCSPLIFLALLQYLQ